MAVRVRLAAVALAFLLPALVLARWLVGGGMTSGAIALPALPPQIGPWTLLAETQLDENDLSILQPDVHLMRRYEAPDRVPIWTYVGIYAGRAAYGKGAHDPAVCYPAQGWEIVGTKSAEVRLADGETLRVQQLDARNESSRQTVVYWFQPAERWPTSAALEELWRTFDAVAGRPQYAFVRLTAPDLLRRVAADDLAESAALIARPVRSAVEGDGEPAALEDPIRQLGHSPHISDPGPSPMYSLACSEHRAGIGR
jgi:EpsI family protein